MVSSKGFPASDADAGYGECMPLQGIVAATYTSAFLDLPCQAKQRGNSCPLAKGKNPFFDSDFVL